MFAPAYKVQIAPHARRFDAFCGRFFRFARRRWKQKINFLRRLTSRTSGIFAAGNGLARTMQNKSRYVRFRANLVPREPRFHAEVFGVGGNGFGA
jgi:hypothetical protein